MLDPKRTLQETKEFRMDIAGFFGAKAVGRILWPHVQLKEADQLVVGEKPLRYAPRDINESPSIGTVYEFLQEHREETEGVNNWRPNVVYECCKSTSIRSKSNHLGLKILQFQESKLTQ